MSSKGESQSQSNSEEKLPLTPAASQVQTQLLVEIKDVL